MAKRTDYRVFYSISRARAALRDAQAARRQLGEQAKLSGRHGRRMSCATPLTLTPSKQAPPCRSYSWTWATETPPYYAPATSTWQGSPAPWQRPTGPSPPPTFCTPRPTNHQGHHPSTTLRGRPRERRGSALTGALWFGRRCLSSRTA